MPGSKTVQEPRDARVFLTCETIMSCNLGTSASLARLPRRELIWRSRVKDGARAKVKVGDCDVEHGGVKRICRT